ncbi:MAG: hypothetical protein CMC38_04470 [Flavobacteriaceae bacterium]|nr:hypothetical protein [Flavobacteriaceae bacterium]|tara:strand:+ start:2706 stop:3362 length:657 start_codon:yes stop_codon:yes gene_type:complete
MKKISLDRLIYNKEIKIIFFLIFFITTSQLFSQIENSKRKIELLPPLSSTLKNLKINPNNPDYFSISKKTESRKESNKSVFESETFLDPGDIYLKKIQKEKQRQPNNYSKGSYLGDVRTNSKYVNIICRDFEYVDGDRVRILVNDSIVIDNLTLDSTFSGFKLPLTPGFNKIDFIALNQGSSGPNTAELRVFDDKDQMISSNQWNLATGGTATFIVVK